jgi:hypothetical protein
VDWGFGLLGNYLINEVMYKIYKSFESFIFFPKKALIKDF